MQKLVSYLKGEYVDMLSYLNWSFDFWSSKIVCLVLWLSRRYATFSAVNDSKLLTVVSHSALNFLDYRISDVATLSTNIEKYVKLLWISLLWNVLLYCLKYRCNLNTDVSSIKAIRSILIPIFKTFIFKTRCIYWLKKWRQIYWNWIKYSFINALFYTFS